MALRVRVVTDVHHNPSDATPKLCSHGIPLLRHAIEETNEQRVDLLVDLGDRIDDRGPDEDHVLAREVAAVFKQAVPRRAHIMGNHDTYSVSRDFWTETLGCTVESTSFDLNGFHVVCFSPVVNNERGAFDYEISPADMDWLRQDLSNTELPSVLFTHVPLMASKMLGNYYVEGKDRRAHHGNSAEARQILQASAVQLVVSGHVHWNSWIAEHGVHYVTVQSLTESFTTWPDPAQAVTSLEIGETIKLDVKGRDPMRLELPRRAKGHGWLRR